MTFSMCQLGFLLLRTTRKLWRNAYLPISNLNVFEFYLVLFFNINLMYLGFISFYCYACNFYYSAKSMNFAHFNLGLNVYMCCTSQIIILCVFLAENQEASICLRSLDCFLEPQRTSLKTIA